MTNTPLGIEAKTEQCRKFWNREDWDRPLVNFRLGGEFPFQVFKGAHPLTNLEYLSPDQLVPERFAEDYDRMIEEAAEVDQDSVFCIEPFWGIPWMEGILGCEIGTSDNSAWVHHPNRPVEEWLQQEIDLDSNPWMSKLLDFVAMQVKIAEGRCAVGQPLLRGPGDCLNALMGPVEAVMALMEGDERCLRVLQRCTDIFLEVVKRLNAVLPEFAGGYCIGAYNIWTPERCFWFQEDATALYSPNLSREYVLPCDKRIAPYSKYHLIHLHPASFYYLDELLKLDDLTCVQANVDNDSKVEDVIPHLQKIQKYEKCLVVEARIPYEELEKILSSIDKRGVFYHLKEETPAEANALLEKIHRFYL